MKIRTLLLVLIIPIASFAQMPGTLDTSFSGDGHDISTLIPSGYHNWSKGIATNNTRIYVAGSATDGTLNRISCLAYTMSGQLDSSFAGDGKFQMTEGGNSTAADIKLQSDGKILILSFFAETSELAIVRLLQDGTPDGTWGDQGVTRFNPTTVSDLGIRMQLQSDGKVLAAGYGDTAQRTEFIARFNTDGTPDLTYGDNGYFMYLMPDYQGLLRDMVIQPDGKAVITVDDGIVNDNHSYIMRINTDGTLDTDFNGNGVVDGFGDRFRAIALAPNGQLLITDEANGRAKVHRFNNDGQRDLAFNGTGYCITDTYFSARKVMFHDGKILVLGCTFNPLIAGTDDFAAYAFNADGTTDTSFGNQGMVATDVGYGDEIVTQAVLQQDGKILATGACHTNRRFVAIRYHGAAAPLGISEYDNHSIALYPNPSDGNATLLLGQQCVKINVIIYNLLGQELSNQEFSATDSVPLHIDGSTGMYLVSVSVDGNLAHTFKMFKR